MRDQGSKEDWLAYLGIGIADGIAVVVIAGARGSLILCGLAIAVISIVGEYQSGEGTAAVSNGLQANFSKSNDSQPRHARKCQDRGSARGTTPSRQMAVLPGYG